MDTLSCVSHAVVEVDGGGHAEVGEGLLPQAGAGGDHRVDRRRERAAVRRPGLVVAVVGEKDLPRELLPEHVHEHHHVGLLDDLRTADALPTEHHVCRKRPGRHVGGDDVFPPEVPVELLVEECLRVEPGHQAVGHRSPPVELAGAQVQARREGRPDPRSPPARRPAPAPSGRAAR